jgi:hypothetical protein
MTFSNVTQASPYLSYVRTDPSYCEENSTFLSAALLQAASGFAYECFIGGTCSEFSQMLSGAELHGDPYLGPRQSIWQKLREKASNLSASCSWARNRVNLGIKHIIESFSHAKSHLLSHNSFITRLRTKLPLPDEGLGEFKSTGLVVSNTDIGRFRDLIFEISNLVTPHEFKEINKVYQAIKTGNSSLKIGGTEKWKEKVLFDIRIILSTQAGRELIYTLHYNLLFDSYIREHKASHLKLLDEYYSENAHRTVFLNNGTILPVYFGKEGVDVTTASDLRVTELFHELTHLKNFNSYKATHNEHPDPDRAWLKEIEYAYIHKWSNKEELNTITASNMFLKALGMGTARVWHEGVDTQDYIKFRNLLVYSVRYFKAERPKDTIRRVYSKKCNDPTKGILCRSHDPKENQIEYDVYFATYYRRKFPLSVILNSDQAKFISDDTLIKCFNESLEGQANQLLKIHLNAPTCLRLPLALIYHVIEEAAESDNLSLFDAAMNSRLLSKAEKNELEKSYEKIQSTVKAEYRERLRKKIDQMN